MTTALLDTLASGTAPASGVQPEPATRSAPVRARLSRITGRHIQVCLGVLWLLDAALQLQPKMFGPAFATGVLASAATGQPGALAWPITQMAHLVAAAPALFDVVFAGVQLIIGIGLLYRPTVRPALALSFAWAAGVWVLGEGFGMLFTPMASPISGAPGAVLLYAVIGVLVWPRRARAGADDDPTAAAVADGPAGERGARMVWAVLWIGMAVLWLLPANRRPGALSATLASGAAQSPVWLAHLQGSLAHVLAGAGTPVAIALAFASLVIAGGPLLARRPGPYLLIGAALALDFWVFGQGLGGVTSGLATDLNSGPLVLLIALALARFGPTAAGAGAAAAASTSEHPVVPADADPVGASAGAGAYCSARMAAISASGSRTTGPVTSTTARVMVPVNGNGAA